MNYAWLRWSNSTAEYKIWGSTTISASLDVFIRQLFFCRITRNKLSHLLYIGFILHLNTYIRHAYRQGDIGRYVDEP